MRGKSGSAPAARSTPTVAASDKRRVLLLTGVGSCSTATIVAGTQARGIVRERGQAWIWTAAAAELAGRVKVWFDGRCYGVAYAASPARKILEDLWAQVRSRTAPPAQTATPARTVYRATAVPRLPASRPQPSPNAWANGPPHHRCRAAPAAPIPPAVPPTDSAQAPALAPALTAQDVVALLARMLDERLPAAAAQYMHQVAPIPAAPSSTIHAPMGLRQPHGPPATACPCHRH